MSQVPPKSTVLSVQFLRALAALAVVFYHCNSEGNGYGFAQTGGWGVDVFFVISGFIVARMIGFSTVGFIGKRVRRIVPLYYLATLAMIAATVVLGSRVNTTDVTPGGTVLSALFVPYEMSSRGGPILEVGWTLEYEMFFYLVIGVMLLLTRSAKGAIIGTAALLTGLALSGYLVPSSSYLLSFYQSDLFFEFLFGVGLWFVYLALRDRNPVSGWGSHLVGSASVVVIVLSVVVLVAADTRWHYDGLHLRFLVYGVPALAVVAAGLALEHRIPSNRLTAGLVEVGDASYAMYLFHSFVILFISRLLFDDLLSTAGVPVRLVLLLVAVAATVVASVVIHRYVDQPLQRLLRRVLARRRPAAVPAPEAPRPAPAEVP